MQRLIKAAGLLSTAVALQVDKESGLEHIKEKGLPSEFNTSRLSILNDIQRGRPGEMEEETSAYDCEKYPHMCKAPFHCEQWTHQDTLDIRMKGIAQEHHANVRSWCMPGLERYASNLVKECLASGNLKAAAKALYKQSVASGDDELEASYCFQEGHCTNEIVNDNTTVFEMEYMCDYRYGQRTGWTRNGVKNLKRIMEMPKAFTAIVSKKEGFLSQRVTRALTKMSCSMGTYHCDVQYCKHTYCRDEYYVKKWEHVMPLMPGHKFQDPDLTKSFLDSQGFDQ